MSALETMNETALLAWQERLQAFKEKARHIRSGIVARMSAAETELHDHGMVENIAAMQLEFVQSRLAQLAAAKAANTEIVE